MWLLCVMAILKNDNNHYNDDEHRRVGFLFGVHFFLEYTYGRTRNRWEDYVKEVEGSVFKTLAW
jgi:hypothetical protein